MISKEECKKIEQSIPLFLEGKLSVDKTGAFLEHLKKCADCREELEINYLLTEGIRRAESGETFNLGTDLDKLITKTELKAIRIDRAKKYLIAAGVVLMILLAVVIIYLNMGRFSF